MQHFQVYKHNFRAHDQQVYSAASSAFPELFPSSPETVKSFKINLPFPALSSTAKIACKKKRGGVFIQSSKIKHFESQRNLPFLSF